MKIQRRKISLAATALAALLTVACSHDAAPSDTVSGAAPAATTSSLPAAPAGTPHDSQDDGFRAAPPASLTGGFDGAKAYAFTAELVSFGPRPSGSAAIHLTQEFINAQLGTFGCNVETDDFNSPTPAGDIAMKNITAKIPGDGQGVILVIGHYDTKKLDNFVGADDGGSSAGLLLELAREMCGAKKQQNAVWIAFLDGEEAVVDWNSNNDNTYGSREMAARLATSGELKRVKAVLLADMIGPKSLKIQRDSNSTPWLVSLVWKVAARLGYQNEFVSSDSGVEDDQLAFTHRGVAAIDITDFPHYEEEGLWHTPQDTMDKLSPRSFAVVGHVFVESIAELQKKFH